jgi:hypothetical protein
MTASLDISKLRSRRVFAALKQQRVNSKLLKDGGGLLEGIFGKLANFGGWAIGGLFNFGIWAIGGIVSWSVTGICDLAVNAYFAIKAFDWNKADAELEATIKANNQAMQVQLSRMIGYQVGFGAVRLVNAFAGFLVNRATGGALQALEGLQIPVLHQRVAIAMAREQGSQLKLQTQAFLQSTAQAQIQNSLAWALLMGRKNGWLGLKPVTGPQTDGSINAKITKAIEGLPKDWQANVAAGLEGLEEGVIGAIYVVAAEADDHLETLRYEKEERRRNQEILTVEVWPDGADVGVDEPLRYVGRQEDVMEAIDATLPIYDQIVQPRGYLAPPNQVHTVRGNPILVFEFTETKESMIRRNGKARKPMRASFRILTDDFSQAADRAKLAVIANKINSQFGSNFRHTMAADSWTYSDNEHGFAFKIRANTEAEARTLAQKLTRCHPDPMAWRPDRWQRGKTRSAGKKTRMVLGELKTVHAQTAYIDVSLTQVDLSIPGSGSHTLVIRSRV